MQTDHTPGPWHAMIDGFVYAQGGERIADAAPWAPIAKNRKEVEINANARLIAAAPDLLAVLQELRESAEYWSEYDVPCGIVARMDAALAKVYGHDG